MLDGSMLEFSARHCVATPLTRGAACVAEPAMYQTAIILPRRETDIARVTAGKIKYLRDKVESLRLEILLPTQVDLPRLAAKRGRPVRFADVDSAPAIGCGADSESAGA
jgi:hypothetical protein